jgi:hypothetical protein
LAKILTEHLQDPCPELYHFTSLLSSSCEAFHLGPRAGNRQILSGFHNFQLILEIMQFCVIKFFARAVQKHDFCMSVSSGRIYTIPALLSSGRQFIAAANWTVAILKTNRSM